MKNSRTLWAEYVRHLAGPERQPVIAERAGVAPATVSRWLSGAKVPTETAHVALLARSYDRNPIEAFVAAGMLTDEEAAGALTKSSRRLLETLRELVEDAQAGSSNSSDGAVDQAASG